MLVIVDSLNNVDLSRLEMSVSAGFHERGVQTQLENNIEVHVPQAMESPTERSTTTQAKRRIPKARFQHRG
jgi:hypothetical protein